MAEKLCNTEKNEVLNNNFGTNQTIALDTDFTCPSNGLVVYGSYQPCAARITVNTIALDYVEILSQHSTTLTKSFRVCAGDVIKIVTDSGTVSAHYFLPTA